MNYADASQLWQKVHSILRENQTPMRYNTWFKDLKLHSVENDKLIAYTKDAFIVRYLREQAYTQIVYAVNNAFGSNYNVEIVMESELAKYEKNMSSSPLNPKYTFDTFVVGAGNRFAHAASLAVAEHPGYAYNPLFIHGGVGLGKTHLMNAISHYILQENPSSTILFTTSENFTNEVVEAIARKKTLELRQKMRTVDVLLIDDVQFLSNRQATQEEFFNTFNALFDNRKQIVLSSDRPPHEIATLEERMRSRFMSGLVVDVQKPDFETRMAILMRKAESENIEISVDAISFIAERIDTNIRELEGGLIRVNALAQLEKAPISREIAEIALKNIVKVRDVKRITPERIMERVAIEYSIRTEDILSERRSRDIAIPRQLAIYLTREMTGQSTTAIGKTFGRDHATIMHACKKMAEKAEKEKDFDEIVRRIKQSISEG